jgi:hypothetical protein
MLAQRQINLFAVNILLHAADSVYNYKPNVAATLTQNIRNDITYKRSIGNDWNKNAFHSAKHNLRTLATCFDFL